MQGFFLRYAQTKPRVYWLWIYHCAHNIHIYTHIPLESALTRGYRKNSSLFGHVIAISWQLIWSTCICVLAQLVSERVGELVCDADEYTEAGSSLISGTRGKGGLGTKPNTSWNGNMLRCLEQGAVLELLVYIYLHVSPIHAPPLLPMYTGIIEWEITHVDFIKTWYFFSCRSNVGATHTLYEANI